MRRRDFGRGKKEDEECKECRSKGDRVNTRRMCEDRNGRRKMYALAINLNALHMLVVWSHTHAHTLRYMKK